MASPSEVSFLTLIDQVVNALEGTAEAVHRSTGSVEAQGALASVARARTQLRLLANAIGEEEKARLAVEAEEARRQSADDEAAT